MNVQAKVMTAFEFEASLGPDRTVKVPDDIAAQLKSVHPFRVLLLLPCETDEMTDEDEAWDRLGEAELFRGYAQSDSIYDDERRSQE